MFLLPKAISRQPTMQKKRLLLLIDNLRKGGAEVLLVGILGDLAEQYDIILVTLTEGCDFPPASIKCKEQYVLGFNGKYSLPQTVWKLKKIIKKTKPDLIHAHLFYSSLVARLACPSKIPLLYSLHSDLSKNIFDKQPMLGYLEKNTIRRNHTVIAVSDLVLDDYVRTIRLTGNHYVLKNYITDKFFVSNPRVYYKENKPAKLIAVGNIKVQKNYEYLLQSMARVKELDISLDIYGKHDHPLYTSLQAYIDEHELKVQFKGPVDDLQLLYPQYDLFIMASKNEGFGLVVVEALACGLPVLLSDIPVFREVTKGNALFFNINDPGGLANLLAEVAAGTYDLQSYVQRGMTIAKGYTKQQYVDALLNIYRETI